MVSAVVPAGEAAKRRSRALTDDDTAVEYTGRAMAGIGVRVGIDVGGTFTDVVFLLADGTALTRKILSSPED
jgi:hypothetical protein